MKARHKLYMVLLTSVFGISACSGGGGDSSSGGGSGTAYAGNYIGPANVRFTGAGGSAVENFTAVVNVAQNGQLSMNFLEVGNDGTQCYQVDPVYLSGSSFSYTANYVCDVPNLGRCNFTESGRGSINGDKMTASVSGTASCPPGSLAMTINYSGAKQTVGGVSFQAASTSGQGIASMMKQAVK